MAVTYTSPTGPIAETFNASGDSNLELNLTIAPSASEAETDMAVVATSGSAGVQSLFFLASAAMTVHCNSVAGGYVSGNNVLTLTLAAGVPYFWITGNGTSPVTSSFAAIYVVSTPGGTLQIRILQGQ